MTRLSIAALAVCAAAAATPAVAQTKLIMDAYPGPKHPLTRGVMVPLSEGVAKATNGRVVIELSKSPLANSRTQWSAVEKGISDVAAQYIGWRRANIKLPALAHLPLMVPSAARASVALWRTQLKFFEAANEFEGMKLLGFTTHNGTQITSRDRAIRSIDDFKGLKVRATPGESTQVVQLLGGSAVTSSGAQVFEFMSKGIVDAVMDGGHAPTAYNIVRYIKYATEIPGSLGAITFAVYMNGKQWSTLSRADQDAVMSAAGETISKRGGEEFDSFSANATSEMRKAGVEFPPISAGFLDALKRELRPVEDAWLAEAAKKGVDGNAAIAYYRSQL